MGADIAIAVPLRPLGMVGAGHAPVGAVLLDAVRRNG